MKKKSTLLEDSIWIWLWIGITWYYITYKEMPMEWGIIITIIGIIIWGLLIVETAMNVICDKE